MFRKSEVLILLSAAGAAEEVLCVVGVILTCSSVRLKVVEALKW